MRVAVDAFGGDNAPLAAIKGAVLAKNEFKVDITLVGDEEKIKAVASENNISLDGVEIFHTAESGAYR